MEGMFFAQLLDRLPVEKYLNLILAVNVKPTNQVASSSNFPGDKESLWRHTLSAQGTQTIWLDETGWEYRPIEKGGTSSAAPLVTGAAALIQGYKPHFSPLVVKACLMHSASRSFYLYNEKDEPITWIYEHSPKVCSSIKQEKFSHSSYGMGILNVRAALQYADFLDIYLKDHENLSFEEYEELRKKTELLS